MPVKFAAIEIVWNTGPDQPEIILGRLNQDTGVVEGGVAIPGMASLLSGYSRSTVITGLSTVPRSDQPPANIVHWAWDGMVLGGSALLLPVAWFVLYWIFRRRLPRTDWFYRLAAICGLVAVFCVECGWVVTEVGRQPWIVYNFLRTADAVTNAGMVRPFFAAVVVIYVLIAIATVLVLRAMSGRWRTGDLLGPIPYGPTRVSQPAETSAPVPAATSTLAAPTSSREA
jgi:cytochrome d ubiquinol oxidase subunit I